MFSSRYLSLLVVFCAFAILNDGFSPSDVQAAAFQEAGSGDKKKKVKAEADERVELLLKVKFDRTPAGILKAWSSDKIKTKRAKKDDKEKKQKPAAGSITNAFKDFVFLTLDETSKFKKDQLLSVVDAEGEVLGEIKLLTVDGKEVSAKVQPKPKKDAKKKEDGEAKNGAAESGEEGGEDNSKDEVEEKSAKVATDEASAAGEKDKENKDGEKPDDKSDSNVGEEKKSTAEVAASEPELPSLGVKIGDKIALTILSAEFKAKQQTERLNKEIAAFSKDVTLGNWDKVKSYFVKIEDKKKADKVYSYLLTELVVAMPHLKKQGAQKRSQAESRGEEPPHSVFTPLDLIAFSEASPSPISIIKKKDRSKMSAGNKPEAKDDADKKDAKTSETNDTGKAKADEGQDKKAVKDGDAKKEEKKADDEDGDATSAAQLTQLGKLLRISMGAGYDMEPFYKKLTEGTTHFGGTDLGKQLTAAHWLMSCNLYDQAETHLPAVDDAKFHDNVYSLRVWNRIANVRYRKKRKIKWLKTVWSINQNIFKAESAEQSDIDSSLARLIELAPQLDKSIGQKWLDDSFSEHPDRGVQILAALGTLSAAKISTANSTSSGDRLKMLKLQSRAVEKVVAVSPEKAAQWGSTLTLLAQNWMKEAAISIEEAPYANNDMDVDRYGNYYWSQNYNSRSKESVKIMDLLPLVPGEEWLEHVTPLVHTKIKKLRARLHMQIKENDEAFALIETLNGQDKKIGKELAEEFLSVWTTHNDANSDRNRRNPYQYYYGYSQKADSIPLTRSKQDRSLTELAGWVEKVRSLDIEDLEEDLLVRAFTTCHSGAEVYQMKRIEAVMGDVGELKAETIASLAQTMRQNLAGIWRSVKNQEEKKTRRTAPEVIREVMRGYAVAHEMTDKALAAHSENWQLHLADACLVMDLNEFQNSIQRSSEFSVLRDNSMEMFANAAQRYIQVAPDLEKSELKTEVFDRWFYAAMGAVDLGKITEKSMPAKGEFPKIKAAIESLPKELAEIHMSRFANNLFSRMSPVKPELKFRYLKSGFEIVGDHPRAWEARELYQYYKDLTGEIKLDLQLDGDANVGTDLFGVYVNLVHTSEIEREAGGFGKYATNQTQRSYSYNYGRPSQDYRDKFIDSVEASLGEHFEVVSVAFRGEEAMKSRPSVERGWRVTPYAYVALQARGSEVDRVSPVAIDMDFLDTSGYVIVPVESTELVVNCSAPAATRPIRDLKLTRTLDERQIEDGKLIMEVSATGKGLIPDLEKLVTLEMDDFEVVSIADQGCMPTAFDNENPEIQIISDRSWSVEYQAKDDAAEANSFAFSDSKVELAEDKIQRYDDADLVDAEPVIELEMNLASGRTNPLYYIVPVLVLGLLGVVAMVIAYMPKREVEADAFQMPDEVNAFTVLSLLKDIKRRNGISEKQSNELDSSINRIESYYFGDDQEETPADLQAIASSWLQSAKKD